MARKSTQSSSPRRESGVTLVELMIVVLIAAVMMSIAVPMFRDGLERNRRLSALESTLGTIASARTEAVSRSLPVSLCPSADGSTCSTNNWEQGVLMFVDDGGVTPPVSDRARTGSEEIIRSFQAARADVTIRSKGGFTALNGITFDGLGRVADNGSIVICDTGGVDAALGVVVNASGQARLATDDNNSGVINLDDANDLGSCP